MTLAKVKKQDGMTLAKVKKQDGMTLAKVKEQDGMTLAKVRHAQVSHAPHRSAKYPYISGLSARYVHLQTERLYNIPWAEPSKVKLARAKALETYN